MPLRFELRAKGNINTAEGTLMSVNRRNLNPRETVTQTVQLFMLFSTYGMNI